MLIKEERTVRTTINIDTEEKYAVEVVDVMAETLLERLEENKKLEMISPATGEIIDKEDLRRLRGVLSGLVHCKEWVLE